MGRIITYIVEKKMIETNNQASFKSDGTGRDLGTLHQVLNLKPYLP